MNDLNGRSYILTLTAGQIEFIGDVYERMTHVLGGVELEYRHAADGDWRTWPAGARINGAKREVSVRAKVDGTYFIELETDIELTGTTSNSITLSGGTIDLLRNISQVGPDVVAALKEKSLTAATVTAIENAFKVALQDASVQSAFKQTFIDALTDYGAATV